MSIDVPRSNEAEGKFFTRLNVVQPRSTAACKQASSIPQRVQWSRVIRRRQRISVGARGFPTSVHLAFRNYPFLRFPVNFLGGPAAGLAIFFASISRVRVRFRQSRLAGGWSGNVSSDLAW